MLEIFEYETVIDKGLVKAPCFFIKSIGEIMEQLLRVGVISSTHGVRGEVKVYPTTDDANRFKKLKKVVLDTGREYIDLEISGVKFF